MAELGGVQIWSPLGQRDGEQAITDYLAHVSELTQGSHCTERALYFLHRCDYDFDLASSLLTPPVEEKIVEDVEEAVYYDEFCFLCGEGGNILLCEMDECMKVYHPACLLMESVPEGRFECAYHNCKTCEKPIPALQHAPYRCMHCPTSFCGRECLPPMLSQIFTHRDHVLMDFQCTKCIDPFFTLKTTQDGKAVSGRRIAPNVPIVLKAKKRSLIAKFEVSKHRFLTRLMNLHAKLGLHPHNIPIIASTEKPLDLPLLYIEVIKRGGFAACNWDDVKKGMHLQGNPVRLKHHYMSMLMEFEKRYYTATPIPLHGDKEDEDGTTKKGVKSNAKKGAPKRGIKPVKKPAEKKERKPQFVAVEPEVKMKPKRGPPKRRRASPSTEPEEDPGALSDATSNKKAKIEKMLA